MLVSAPRAAGFLEESFWQDGVRRARGTHGNDEGRKGPSRVWGGQRGLAEVAGVLSGRGRPRAPSQLVAGGGR